MEIDRSIVKRVSGLLARHQMTLVLAESMTGGAIAAALSMEEHAGDFLLGSIVCYSDHVKQCILDISPELITSRGGVSGEVTAALVDGLSSHFPTAKLMVAVTGFAFESPATTEEDPVGTVYIHLRLGVLDTAEKYVLEGDSEEIVRQTVSLVLLLIEDKIHQLLE